jgi:hypothetical protein
MPEKTITIAHITKQPVKPFDAMPEVIVGFSDGTSTSLFTYYPDEISFTETEFLGLTESEAHALRQKKDVAYLKS